MVLSKSNISRGRGLNFPAPLRCSECDAIISGTGHFLSKNSQERLSFMDVLCFKCYAQIKGLPRKDWDKRYQVKSKPRPEIKKNRNPWADIIERHNKRKEVTSSL